MGRKISNSTPKTRQVVVRVCGYRTVESVGDIVLAVPATMTDEEVEEGLEDMHDLLPYPQEWEDLEDEAEIEINMGIQPFGVRTAPSGMDVQASFWTGEDDEDSHFPTFGDSGGAGMGDNKP